MSIQRKLEVGLISAASRSRKAMADISRQLNGYEFSDPTLQWMWLQCKAVHAKGETVSLTTLEGKLRTEPDDAQQPIMEALLEVWRAPISESPHTDCETLQGYHRTDTIIKGMDRATKAITRGDVDGAQAMLSRLSLDAAPQTGLQVTSVLDFDDWNAHDQTMGIETGIRTYDEVTMGGPRPGDAGLIFGTTGMGKSLLGTNFGFNAFKRKRRVLHIDSENGLQETRVRYVARATRLPSRGLTRRGLNFSDDFRRWADGQRDRIHQHLRILSIGVEQAPMQEIDAKIAELGADGWSPELIIFDSPDHVVWQGSIENAGAVAKAQYAKVKSMAQRYEAVVWAITQAKQEAEGKIATNKHAAWGYDKSRLADSVLTINPGLNDKGQPMSEKEMGDKRCLFVSKARKSAGRFIVPLITNFATAYIAEQLEGDSDPDGEETDQAHA